MGKGLRKKITALFLLLFVVWIPISLVFKPNHPVTDEEIRKYGETYLSTFRNEVYQFNPKDRVYFPDFTQFWNKCNGFKATISESHGAAIEFVLNSTFSAFQAKKTDERIEVAILGGVFSRQQGLPLSVRSAHLILSFEQGVTMLTGGLTLFEVFDNASITLIGSDWTLNGVRYTNPITIKGSNMWEAWKVDKAIWDAKFDFKYDLAYALNKSEGVREYVAYAELKERLNDIANKLKNDPNYGWSQLHSDVEEISRIAREKYGVIRPEFVQDVLHVLEKKNILSKKLPILQIEYRDNFWFTLFFSAMMDFIYVAIIFLDRLPRYLEKRAHTTLAKIVKELKNTLLPIGGGLVGGFYFLKMAPFDYDWITQMAIFTAQFAMVVAIKTVLENRKPIWRPDWSRLMRRAGLGVLFLTVFLISTHYWIHVFFSIPLMFSLHSILIGDVTPLSILVATIAVLVVEISQLIYGRFFG